MKRGFLVLALGALALAGWAAHGSTGRATTGAAPQASAAAAPQPTRPSWRVPEGDAEHGAQLATTCLACHGETPTIAEPLAPRLSRQRASYVFFALLAYRDGLRSDPVMGPMAAGLSDQDARDLAAALSGEMLDRPPPPQLDNPGYAPASRQCLWCHGETGIGEFEGMPVLAGQDRDYLVRALTHYRDGTRSDPTMSGVAAGLSDAEIAAIAGYYSAHEWLERVK